MTPKQDALIARALSFTEDQQFDGYPTTSEYDITLIQEAAAEANSPDVTQFLAFVLSCAATTKDEADNAQRFYQDFVKNTWDCNVAESSNPVFDIDPE
jgi:hypothetical protein